jgi:transcriptional antiterminator RfaH
MDERMPGQAAPGSFQRILAPMLRWYVIHTKPSREALAEVNLQRQGYVIYAPRMVRVIRRRTQSVECIVPLFPRYVFLQLSEGSQALNPVRSSIGVSDVVRFGARYAIVPERIIAELRSRADPETGLHRLTNVRALTRGTSVRITTGPFEGLDGIFEREAGAARVVILLNLLGQDAAVRIPVDSVAPNYAA